MNCFYYEEPELAPGDKVDHNWSKLYPYSTEEIPTGIHKPKGNPATVSDYFDTNNDRGLDTYMYVYGIIIFLNKNPVQSYCNRQERVKNSTYGSEFVVGIIINGIIVALRYRLIILGFPTNGTYPVYGDDMSVITNFSLPSSGLNKKNSAIAYHKVR